MKTFLKSLPWVLLAAAVIVILFMWQGCGKPKWQEQPKVESVKDKKAKLEVIVKEDTRGRDSALMLLSQEQQNTATLTDINQAIQNDYNSLQQKLNAQSKIDCPNLTPELERLSGIRNNELKSHGKIVSSLNKQISINGKMIADCDQTKRKLLAQLDSSFKDQTTLQKSNDKLRPRVQFVLSAEAFGYSGKIINGYAVGAGIRFKNGTMALIKAYQINGQTNYGGQVVFPISFRK